MTTTKSDHRDIVDYDIRSFTGHDHNRLRRLLDWFERAAQP